MAQRRMFSPDIVSSEEFLSMPVSSRELYFQLGMNADDDGFIQPKLVIRILGATEDDLKVLLAKRFLLPFQSGVVVIKHWLIHNMIRADRYKPTRFQEEKKLLFIKENKAYTDKKLLGCQNGNQPAPQVRLGKVRLIVGNSLKANSKSKTMWKEEDTTYDEDGNIVVPYKEKKELAAGRVESERLLKFYNAQYKKLVGDEIPYYPKPAYLKQANPVIAKYGVEKLEKLLLEYFDAEDEYIKQSNWAIWTFLSWKVLNRLNK